jgi:WD40 repeat protein
VLGRHAALIRSLAFSPDGKRLVSASEDRTAKLWDVHDGKEVLSFQGHTSSLTSVAFSPDGELVATSSDDQTVRLWAARSGQPLQSVHPGGTPFAVAFGPDGHRLAAGCAGSVVVYQLAERLGRQLPGHRLITMALAVHPRKPLVASASRQSAVSLEDLVTGQELHTWNFAGLLGRLAFSPDGRMLAVAPYAVDPTYQAGGNKDVYLVDTENGKTRKLVLGDVSAAVAFDSAGRLLAVGHQSGAVTVWNAQSGEMVHRWRSPSGWISEVAFCRGSQLLVAEVGGSLRLCDMVDGRTIRERRLPRGLVRFVVDPAERQVAAVDLWGTVRVLTLPDLQQVGTIDRSDGLSQAGFVGLGFSGDGRFLAIGGADCRVSIHDARTLRRMIQLPPQNGAVYDVAFQRHGFGLAQGGADEMLSFWDLSQIELALAANGLGWEGAPPDGVPGTSQTGPVPRVRLERGWGTRDEPINWYLQQVLKTNPDQADLSMELAWVQVMGPTKFRDAAKALPLARRAVAPAPDEPLCLNTLGVVYYRLGQWKEAADTLQASAQTNPEGPGAYDLFFQAMAYQQTGQPAKAKDCYDQAVRWCRAHGKLAQHQLAELLAIRAEAEGLLGPSAGERRAAELATLRTDNSPSLPAGGADTNKGPIRRAGVADANKAPVVPAARAAVRPSSLVIESPREGATVGMREDLTGRIRSEGWPVIYVQPDIPGQPWWCQAPVAKIDGGKFTTKVHFGDELTPSGTKFRIAGIVARTREEALEFNKRGTEHDLPEGFPQTEVVVVTLQ